MHMCAYILHVHWVFQWKLYLWKMTRGNVHILTFKLENEFSSNKWQTFTVGLFGVDPTSGQVTICIFFYLDCMTSHNVTNDTIWKIPKTQCKLIRWWFLDSPRSLLVLSPDLMNLLITDFGLSWHNSLLFFRIESSHFPEY